MGLVDKALYPLLSLVLKNIYIGSSPLKRFVNFIEGVTDFMSSYVASFRLLAVNIGRVRRN